MYHKKYHDVYVSFRIQQWPFFLSLLIPDFRLRHLLEVKISRTSLPALIFGLASEQKISLGILRVHMKG